MSAPTLAETQARKGKVEWGGQAFWLAVVLFGGPALAGTGLVFHAVVVIIIGLASIAWIEYVARARDNKPWVIFAVIMGALALWGAHDRERG